MYLYIHTHTLSRTEIYICEYLYKTEEKYEVISVYISVYNTVIISGMSLASETYLMLPYEGF